MIRKAKISDAAQIAKIYNYYVENTIITFDINQIDNNTMAYKIQNIQKKYPWLVYEENGKIQGYTYANEWKSKDAYNHTVESTVYLNISDTGKGVGSKLYSELISQLQDLNIHTIIGGISLPNEASTALHQKFGFRKVATFEEVGKKFEKWVDVAYWQLII